MSDPPPQPETVRGPGSPTVLILTASMGAGHDGVAQELARRFRERGYGVEVLDILAVLPGVIGRTLRRSYALMLRWAPWLYDLIFRLWFEPTGGGGPVSPVTILAERRIARWVAANQPVVAISTFHLCSTVLGGLRRKGLLSAPSVSVVVDMAVHRLWVDPDVDLHLCLHPAAAAEAKRRGAPEARAPGPTVRPCFSRPAWDRLSARASLGMADGERVVLMVAGSWGAGDIGAALGLVQRRTHLTPLVVCGADDGLRRRLRRQAAKSAGAAQEGGATLHAPRILGWVDDMAQLMAASDVVLENAGGLTSMEALALGVPVVSFRPIPGHGRANVEAMAGCDLLAWARDPEDLVRTLEEAASEGPLRARLAKAGAALMASDAVDDILAMLETAGPAEPRRPAGAPLPAGGADPVRDGTPDPVGTGTPALAPAVAEAPARSEALPAAPEPAVPLRSTSAATRARLLAGTDPDLGKRPRRRSRERRRRRFLGQVPRWRSRGGHGHRRKHRFPGGPAPRADGDLHGRARSASLLRRVPRRRSGRDATVGLPAAGDHAVHAGLPADVSPERPSRRRGLRRPPRRDPRPVARRRLAARRRG